MYALETPLDSSTRAFSPVMQLADRPPTCVPVLDAAPHSISGLNQKTYTRLKTSLKLNLRRQIFLAVCDDLELRNRLVANLQAELAPRFVSLNLNLADPNPMAQVSRWLVQQEISTNAGVAPASYGFQILGVEHLTRQPAAVQKRFLTHLQAIEYYMPALECTMLLWLPRPWLRSLQQNAPTFWEWHTALFEFEGDPTPAKLTLPTLEAKALAVKKSEARKSEARRSETKISKTKAFGSQPSSLAKSESASPPPTQKITKPASKNSSRAGLTKAILTGQALLQFSEDEDEPEIVFDRLQQEKIWNILAQDLAQLEQRLPVPAERLPETERLPEILDAIDLDAIGIEDLKDLEIDSIETIAPAQEAFQSAISSAPSANVPLPDSSGSAPFADSPFSNFQLMQMVVAAIAEDPTSELHQTALQSLQKLAQLDPQQLSQSVLGATYYTIGRYYREDIEQGDTSEQTLAIAICAHEQALECLEDDSHPWSDVANDLGNLYWMRSRSSMAAEVQLVSLEQAIQAYQLALHYTSPQVQPKTYAMIQNNLGSAYGDLAQYHNPSENLQKSVQAYETALSHRPADEDPARYAATQNNLGTACWNLAQHQQPVAYLNRAIAAYGEALRYYTTDNEPLSYAMIQNNLGTAYWNLAQHGQSTKSAANTETTSAETLLRSAIAAYQHALAYRTLEAAPASYAATQNNLGTAYWDLANLAGIGAKERRERLQQAITAYEAAIAAVEVLTARSSHRPALTFDVFATYNNLGLAYYQLATDKHSNLKAGDRHKYLESALDRHLQALQGWEPLSDFHQSTLGFIIQTVRTFFSEYGIQGQNLALSRLPAHLLPELMSKL